MLGGPDDGRPAAVVLLVHVARLGAAARQQVVAALDVARLGRQVQLVFVVSYRPRPDQQNGTSLLIILNQAAVAALSMPDGVIRRLGLGLGFITGLRLDLSIWCPRSE